MAPERVRVQVVPLQPLVLQPEKTEPLPGVAVSATGTPSLKVPVQLGPPAEVQVAIPPGLELTEPLPATVTVMVC